MASRDVELGQTASTGIQVPITRDQRTNTQVSTTSDDFDTASDVDLPGILRVKLAEWQDAIQPHTDEGGNPYYIGDIYGGINADYASAWKVDK